MAENDFEKTEPATGRRREEARQEGQVARSTDLTAACTLLAGVLLLNVFGLKILEAFRRSVQLMLSGEMATNPTRLDDVHSLFAFGLRVSVEALAPIVLCLSGLAVAITVAQVGFRLTPQALMPRFNKLSPFQGFSRFFDMRSGMRLMQSLAKIALLFTVAGWIVYADIPRIVLLSQLQAGAILVASCELIYSLALKLALLLLVLGIADYAYQWWQHEKDLRMSKQEIKDEMRRMEGDPLIKQRRARVARQLALQRINSAVPRADVIVTNPTHYAVALRYDPTTMKAPKVIAKGADFLAQRIRQLAMVHGVPMVERRELAQTLYRNVEIGQEVPPEFYNAIAEILAYVYRLSGRKIA